VAEHTHLIEFPEALEAFFSRVGELRSILGDEGVGRVERLVAEGLAARDRGDAATAIARIVAAMEEIGRLAAASGAPEAPMLAGMAARFRQAVARRDVGLAKEAADVMREESGSRLVPKKPR
jgi:hypothetical protein